MLMYLLDVKSILNFILRWFLLRAGDSPIFFLIIQNKAQMFTNKSALYSIWNSFIHKKNTHSHSLYKWGQSFVYHAMNDYFWSIPLVIYFFQSSFSFPLCLQYFSCSILCLVKCWRQKECKADGFPQVILSKPSIHHKHCRLQTLQCLLSFWFQVLHFFNSKMLVL